MKAGRNQRLPIVPEPCALNTITPYAACVNVFFFSFSYFIEDKNVVMD